MELYKNVKVITANTRSDWREWLSDHHLTTEALWLVIYKNNSSISSVTYAEAVDEALCFGWIDSKPNKRDDKSYYQYFSKRNPKSNWSKVNKAKVEKLVSAGLMTESGMKMIQLAKETGTWDTLNDVDNLVVPDDMMQKFTDNKKAYNYWSNFPDSVKRGILEWIFTAKRSETRLKRIEETVRKAEMNKRANQFRN